MSDEMSAVKSGGGHTVRDIVDRLRSDIAVTHASDYEQRGYGVKTDTETLAEAADEIVRLREALAAARGASGGPSPAPAPSDEAPKVGDTVLVPAEVVKLVDVTTWTFESGNLGRSDAPGVAARVGSEVVYLTMGDLADAAPSAAPTAGEVLAEGTVYRDLYHHQKIRWEDVAAYMSIPVGTRVRLVPGDASSDTGAEP